MARIQGIQRLTVDGDDWDVGDSASVQIGGISREVQKGQTAIDHTAQAAEGVIEVELMTRPDRDERALLQAEALTVVLTLRNGITYSGANMVATGEPPLDGVRGRFSVRFSGPPLERLAPVS